MQQQYHSNNESKFQRKEHELSRRVPSMQTKPSEYFVIWRAAFFCFYTLVFVFLFYPFEHKVLFLYPKKKSSFFI